MTTPDIAPADEEPGFGYYPLMGLRWRDMLSATRTLGLQALRQPALVLQQEAGFARRMIQAVRGAPDQAPEMPAKADKRYADPAWQHNPLYRALRQGHGAWSDALEGFVEQSSMDAQSKARARFAVSMLTDALAPTNSVLGNPAVLKKTLDQGGGNLLDGAKHLLDDWKRNGGMPAQVDTQAFRVGADLAVSPGAVVFRNEVLELIQYRSLAAEVHARPHLIVPPQINKYYAFDLAPGRSIVEFLTRSGFQVFVVSWRNPTAAQRDWDMGTYVAALLEALEAVIEITGADDAILHGACSGAMTMAALLGHLAATRRPLVHAATLMVALLGPSDDSQLGLFATPKTVAAAKRASALKGVLEGSEMARVFAWLRPNDLVWNYWVNNYLLGNAPPAFDVLYWNNDTTRLPARFHGQLLDIFAEGLLHRPGAFEVLGTPIDLHQVACDTYVLAGATDHITPWKGVYDTARAFGGQTEFVLSSSGHVQSLINPPGNAKAKYHVSAELPERADAWLAGAQAQTGSWWTHWRDWLAARSGPLRPAPAALGSERHPAGVDAPGVYVLEA